MLRCDLSSPNSFGTMTSSLRKKALTGIGNVDAIFFTRRGLFTFILGPGKIIEMKAKRARALFEAM
jgi:hypothetical protein